MVVRSKFLTFGLLVCCVGMLSFGKVTAERKRRKAKISIISHEQTDFTAEQALYEKAYNHLYDGVTDAGLKTDLKAGIVDAFNAEKALVCDENSGVVGIKVMRKGVVVGFATLHETGDPEKRLLKAFAIDQDRKRKRIARKLLRFTFKKYPAIKKILIAVRNESETEKTFLEEYRFAEVETVLPGYDAELYTVFRIKRKKQQ